MEIKNKLIAEFMGVYSKECGFDYTKTGNKGINYHKSWDWLIPVVQKCYKIDDEEGFDNLVDEVSTLKFCLSFLNFDATYQAVIKFIEQYNKTINI